MVLIDAPVIYNSQYIMVIIMKFRIRVNISGEVVELYKTARSESEALVYAFRQLMKLYNMTYANVAGRFYEVKPVKSISIEGGL